MAASIDDNAADEKTGRSGVSYLLFGVLEAQYIHTAVVCSLLVGELMNPWCTFALCPFACAVVFSPVCRFVCDFLVPVMEAFMSYVGIHLTV